MTQNDRFDEVDDFVSFEAVSAMAAVGMDDETEHNDEQVPEKDNHFSYQSNAQQRSGE